MLDKFIFEQFQLNGVKVTKENKEVLLKIYRLGFQQGWFLAIDDVPETDLRISNGIHNCS